MTPEEREKALAKGGFSVRLPAGTEPTDGFMASEFGSERVTNNVAAAADIEAHAATHAEQLQEPGTYQGGWMHEDQSYLDVSKRFRSASNAHEFARRNAQIATYDVAAETERLVHYGPSVSPRTDISNPLLEHRVATAKKNAAYRGSVRQHLIERGRQPTTQDEIRAAGERIGHAVYNNEQLSKRLEHREAR